MDGWFVYHYLGTHFSVDYYAKTRKDRIQNAISLAAVFVSLFFYLIFVKDFIWAFGLPWLVYNAWVYSVTFLQHHHDDMIVYKDDDYDFMTGAVQTIDRNFGFGLDEFTHHISNGHVAHHIFFTQVPITFTLLDSSLQFDGSNKGIILLIQILAPALGTHYKRETRYWISELLMDHFALTRRAMHKREDGNYQYSRAFKSSSDLISYFFGVRMKAE